MHSDSSVPAVEPEPVMRPIEVGERTSLHLLVEEASRQLNICNSCRYCEGFCAVFPALERRNLLEAGDVSQLANLCHDCRACFDACMYTEPHEFAVNPPRVLSAVRLADYQRHVWPRTVPRIFRGWPGLFSGAVLAALVVLVVAVVGKGVGALVAGGGVAASPYQLVPYPALLVLLILPAMYSVVVMTLAVRRYWQSVGGAPDGLRAGAVWRAVWDAATLRYLRGGGRDCYYPDEKAPSPARRHLHAMVAYGFGLCVVSTISAGVMQDFLGWDPPYDWDSAPVVAGTIGGVGLLAGCVGLLRLKTRSAEVASFAQMTVKDYGLLTALGFLALSGLAALLTRTTPAYGIVFLVHLSAVMFSFAVAPYSKFMHVVYRFAALVRDNLERERLAPA